MHIFVESKDGSVARREVATLKPVPKGRTTVEFTIVGGVDLLPYLSKGAQMTATATGRQPMTDFTYNGKLVFEIRI